MTAQRITNDLLFFLAVLIVALGYSLFGSVGEVAFSVAEQQGSGE